MSLLRKVTRMLIRVCRWEGGSEWPSAKRPSCMVFTRNVLTRSEAKESSAMGLVRGSDIGKEVATCPSAEVEDVCYFALLE